MKQQLWSSKLTLFFMVIFLFSPSLTFAEKGRNTEKNSKNSQQKNSTASSPDSKRKLAIHDFNFDVETAVEGIIRNIAQLEQINVVYEDTIAKLVETKKTKFVAKGLTAPKALEIFFNSQRLGYAYVGKKTILVFADALVNKQRYDSLNLRVFPVRRSNMDSVQSAIQQAIGAKQIISFRQQSCILVRDTEDSLRLIEDLISRIDKPQPEFTIDVNLYQVSEQVAAKLGDPSGVLSASDISLLQNKSSAKLVGSTKIHSVENEVASLNMGVRTPIKVKSTRQSTTKPKVEANKQGEQSEEDNVNQSSLAEEIQYVDSGLGIELTPSLSDNNVQMKLSLSLVGATEGKLNVNFNQNSVKGVIGIKKGETKVVANLFPVAASLFSSSTLKNDFGNLIVTFTPHIVGTTDLTSSERMSFGPIGNATNFDSRPTLEGLILQDE